MPAKVPLPSPTAAAGISDRVAAHIADTRFEQLPAVAIAAAKASLLDTVGVILAASTLGDGCAAFAELVREEGGAPVATVLGYGFRAPARGAALANGAMAHALDFEDAHDQAPVHPSAQVVPAALALAEQLGADGRSLITALALGTDLSCRLALALTDDPLRYGWYVPPIVGAFGATAAAASLLGLNAGRVRDALSLTLSHATASAEVIDSPDSLVRGVRDGFAAAAAVLSATLAARGVIGFPRPLEGRAGLFALYARGGWEPAAVRDGLGERFEGARASLKPWPSCRATHPFIDAALSVAAEHDIDAGEIESVTLFGAPWSEMLAVPLDRRAAPATPIDAKFSLPFSVATALRHGRVTLDSFTPEALNDPSVRALARRVRYVSETGQSDGHAAVTRGRLELATASGRVLSAGCTVPYGGPERPLSPVDLRAKFTGCAAHAMVPLTPAATDAIADAVLSLEQAADVREVTAPLIAPTRT